jgi:hypothetical protein
MLTLESRVTMPGVTGLQVTDFMLDCADDRYRAWWPGTHLQFHPIRIGVAGDHLGDVVWMDEYVGSRRLRMRAVVEQAAPGRRIVWRMSPLRLRLPVHLTLEVEPQDGGVRVRHTLTAGWRGAGRVLDPLWRVYFSRRFAAELDEHARTEFPLLADLLRNEAG